MNFEHLLGKIGETDQILHAKAFPNPNHILILRNWCTGAHIIAYEQAGEDRAEYGEKLFETLFKSLRDKGIEGYSPQKLGDCRGFYLAYQNLLNVLAKAQPHEVYKMLQNSIQQTAPLGLQEIDNEDFINHYLSMFQRLSYAHFVELSKLKDEAAREYYEHLTVSHTLPVRSLKKNIECGYYENSLHPHSHINLQY